MANFDMNVFKNNIDPTKVKKALTIGGKVIPLPEGTDVAVQVNGDYIRVTIAKAEHRELQLAGESRVVSTDFLYNDKGEAIVEFSSDTGWAVSQPPTLGVPVVDPKQSRIIQNAQKQGGKKIIQ